MGGVGVGGVGVGGVGVGGVGVGGVGVGFVGPWGGNGEGSSTGGAPGFPSRYWSR